MEAKELMLGDWVRISDDDTHEYFDAQIKGVDFLDNVYAQIPGEEKPCPFSIDCVEPVPLTPEILEKNGWSHSQLHGSYGRKGMRIDGPPYEELPDGIKNLLDFAQWSIDEEFQYHLLEIYMWRGSIRLWVNYVHELQHALRLCGIDKEIVV